MPTYAKDTEVPIDRSKSEIERILQRYGATAFMYGWNEGKAIIGFSLHSYQYRIVLPLPAMKDFERTPARQTKRSQSEMLKAYAQGTRQRWRALALWIKAVLEANEANIVTLEEALQAFVLLPNGRTVSEWLAPQLYEVYQTGRMPPLLSVEDDMS